jgi:hypothetical protein
MGLKLSKSEARRLILAVKSKTQKLWLSPTQLKPLAGVVSTADMAAIEKLTSKWLKRLG